MSEEIQKLQAEIAAEMQQFGVPPAILAWLRCFSSWARMCQHVARGG